MVEDIDTIKVLDLKQFSDSDSDFYVNSLSEHLRTSHRHINKPHKHDFYATVLFTRGTGKHEIDFTVYDVVRGSIFFLKPGQTHHWTLSDDSDGLIFFHSKEYYETQYLHSTLRDFAFFSSLLNIANAVLNEDEIRRFEDLVQKMWRVNLGVLIKKQSLIVSLLTQLYIELEQYISPAVDSNVTIGGNYYGRFLEFENLLENNFHTIKSVAGFAEKMNVTPKHLNRITKLILNKTTSQLISDRVVLEAKRLMLYSKENLKQIADKLGYDDYAHFSKLFKSKTGMTPGEFKKRYV